MNLAQAILQDVLSNPDDLAPRLVYADWLDDHGNDADRDRAEFIRAQCQIERLADNDPQRATLVRRTRQLLGKYRKIWTAPLSKARLGLGTSFTFRRGFVEGVQLTAERFVKVGGALFDLAPVRLIRFPYAVRETSELAASPLLARLSGADLTWMCSCGTCPIHDELHELYESPNAANLTTLSLERDRMDAREVRRLTASPHLTRLTSLNLADNAVGATGIRHLAASKFAATLTELDLSQNDLTSDDVAVLAEARRFTSLRVLALRENDLGVTALRILARAENLAGLTTLDLQDNGIADSAAKALANATSLSNLTRLDVRGCGLSRAGLKALRGRFGNAVRAI